MACATNNSRDRIRQRASFFIASFDETKMSPSRRVTWQCNIPARRGFRQRPTKVLYQGNRAALSVRLP